MTTAQKVIKYLAIAFAIFLIITIISTTLSVLVALSGILGLKKYTEENAITEMATTDFGDVDISALDIDVAFTNLKIKTGDILKVETNNNKINCKKENEKLKIIEKNRKIFSTHNENELILYLPENLKFEKVEIETGAGEIQIESLSTEKLSFELGAGETKIQNLNISKECEIEGGAGKLTIVSGTINDLDLDMGVGEIELTANLTGKNQINAGIGNLDINLQGEKEFYKIDANKGIGSIKIDKNEISNGETFGKGENVIQIDGGIGNIDIGFIVEGNKEL